MMANNGFPAPEPGLTWLTEGGTETEILFRHGHELREFAMFELLDKPSAVDDLRDMYRRYLDVAAEYDMGALVAGLDYRASPDWGAKLGYSAESLAAMQRRCIDFLREAVKPYRGQLPRIAICGCVGPRGDAYDQNRGITADDAEAYHTEQLKALRECDVDLVWAATFNSVEEAVGVSRAAAAVDLPVNISFTLAGDSRLRSGPTLREAVEETDRRTGERCPAFYSINCSHPLEYAPALDGGAWMRRLRGVRPNAVQMEKVALCKLGHIEEGDPAELGAQLGDLARDYPHMDIFGGCCGTWDEHFKAIAREVSAARAA